MNLRCYCDLDISLSVIVMQSSQLCTARVQSLFKG